MPFTEPGEPDFESNEPLNEALLEKLALIFLKATFPQILQITVSEEEKQELQEYLRRATEAQTESIRVRMLFLRRYFEYINPNASDEAKAKIEQEMDGHPALQEFIEKRRAIDLADEYVAWKTHIMDVESDSDLREIGIEMSLDDIYTFLSSLEKYPNEIDTRFDAASMKVVRGPYANSKPHFEADTETYRFERLKLLALKKSVAHTITADEQTFLDNTLTNDKYFRKMSEKIKEAWRS